ncbi:hypothetical protein FOZ62_004520 [Perkinsus olseni]|uniref:Uncharacterized protein n=2 Tax=Perkinsus olseni TaxID=32597 RepID=A0A7J6SVV7_PEROL|nr:hypothetical protein FOZ62_004520 [Perkinsus olseni]
MCYTDSLSPDLSHCYRATARQNPVYSLRPRTVDPASKETRPGPADYTIGSTVTMDHPTITKPRLCRFMGASRDPAMCKNPGPGAYTPGPINLLRNPQWTMTGRQAPPKSKSIGPGIGQYRPENCTAKGSIWAPQWSMQPRRAFDPARGFVRDISPGPAAYRYGVYTDGYIHRPPKWSFSTSKRFQWEK